LDLKNMDITFGQWKNNTITVISDISNNVINLLERISETENDISEITGNLLTSNINIGINTSAIEQLQNTKANKTIVDAITNKLVNLSFSNGSTIITNSTKFIDTSIDDLNIENSLSINGSCIISNVNYEITDEQFNYLSSINSDYQTTINNIKSDISGNSNNIPTHTNNILQINNKILDLSGNVLTNKNDITIIKNNINDISGNVLLNNNDISDLKNDSTIQLGYINGLDNRILVTENNILTNSNAILTKQPIINSENRLNSNVIGDGSISNLMFQSLYNIKTNESIQHQIDTLFSSKKIILI